MPKRSIKEAKERLRRRGKTGFPAEWIFEPPGQSLSADEWLILGHLRDKVLPLADRGAIRAAQLRQEGEKLAEIAKQLGVPERTVRFWLQRKLRQIRTRSLQSIHGLAYIQRDEGGSIPIVVLRLIGSCRYEEYTLAKSEVDHVGMDGSGYCRRCKRVHEFNVVAQCPAPFGLVQEWLTLDPRSRVAVGMKKRFSELFLRPQKTAGIRDNTRRRNDR